uniref:Uncharacterized protein n=1 Tax=Chromera velia CCMP2878 TaxID=1169474 RepID=A0A0G4FIT0_9ALVE|mmetsp:Transcript_36991/g.72749  ORF Transcript_36991/g.72749 Transcript_36991/m.72749 type:complete len:267 (-) Transcript_36991:97-897(-)|eukprot:Cvel_3391.t1-p1 / transcript=Cvel_3391.t1 / gene=Cvel_3391 / organism=Chromera_velia_CCMP2878 / gene_product=hypothetical protein / transcript_product=hypothetical protein / location=Cvel_scaffold136:99887-100684(+) / protein_length=266 / sequence_SO=supercontig / SO=protein_coding / is_pseudo=false
MNIDQAVAQLRSAEASDEANMKVPRADESQRTTKDDIKSIVSGMGNVGGSSFFGIPPCFLPVVVETAQAEARSLNPGAPEPSLDLLSDVWMYFRFFWWVQDRIGKLRHQGMHSHADVIQYFTQQGQGGETSFMNSKERQLLEQLDTDTLTRLARVSLELCKRVEEAFKKVRIEEIDSEMGDVDEYGQTELKRFINFLLRMQTAEGICASLLVSGKHEVEEFVQKNRELGIFHERETAGLDLLFCQALRERGVPAKALEERGLAPLR